MAESRILEISAQETYPLRSLVLRNSLLTAPCPFDGDLDKTTHHFACVFENEIVAIVSFYKRNNDSFGNKTMVQLRGMATHPTFSGLGFGKNLIKFSIGFFHSKVQIIWCNAREIAIPFYEKLGFRPIGDKFEIQNIGTHILMYYEF